jgi:hypothetical protein
MDLNKILLINEEMDKIETLKKEALAHLAAASSYAMRGEKYEEGKLNSIMSFDLKMQDINFKIGEMRKLY